MTQQVTLLKNELIVYIPELDWTPKLLRSLKDSATAQIAVDDVMHFVTPFGAHMLCVQMSVTRARATTHDLKEYLCRVLGRNGLDVDMAEIHTPSRAKRFRAA